MEVIVDNQGLKIVHVERETNNHTFDLSNESFDFGDLRVPNAVVILNGWWIGNMWEAGEDNKAHDVQLKEIELKLTNCRIENRQLKWDAHGDVKWEKDGWDSFWDVLSKFPWNNFDGSSFIRPKWRYYYTVIAWGREFVNGVTDRVTIENNVIGSNLKSTPERVPYPIVAYSSFHHNELYEGLDKIGVLPQGFGMRWPSDHHLFQIGYKLGCSEQFAEDGKNYARLRPPVLGNNLSRYRSGYVSWSNQTIFRDKGYRVHDSHVWHTTLAGKDFEWIDPPFGLYPHNTRSRPSGIIGDNFVVRSQEYTIDHLPYTYAVPILAGWDLKYSYGDEHVSQMGVWLSDISYVRVPGQLTGKLNYTLNSVLRDKDDIPSFETRHKVNILGINPKGAAPDVGPIVG